VLDPASQSAAAQQKRVDHKRLPANSENDNAGESVAAEAVFHVDREALQIFGGERLHLRFVAPQAGCVHLIGSLGQLSDARELLGKRGCDLNLELQ
jgi:hypothetical protein